MVVPKFKVLLSFLSCLCAGVASAQSISPDEGLQAQYEEIFYSIAADGDKGFQGTPTSDMLENAISKLGPLAKAEHGPSAGLLGSIYIGFFGDQIEPDFSKARSSFLIAMNARDQFPRSVACLNLAFLSMDAVSESEDWLEVRTFAECAREDDDLAGEVAKPLAFSYLFGPDQEAQISKAEPLLREALLVDPEDGHSTYLLAKGLRDSWFEETNHEEGCQKFIVASELEEMRAYWYAGMCYLNGIHVEKNEGTAFKWVSLAAESGEVEGLISVAVMHALGQGTEVSRDKAAASYEAAIHAAPRGSAKQGHALRGLGSMHAFGELEDGNGLFGYTMLVLAEEFGDDQAPLLLQRFDDLEPDARKQIEIEKKRIRELYDLPTD